ncbi:hypothetical protein ACWEQL_35340 [Kitasatospora sp. NPDC004240]
MTHRRTTTTERAGRAVTDGPSPSRPLAVLAAAGLLLIGGCGEGGPATSARPANGTPTTAGAAPSARSGVLPGGLGDPATAPTGVPVFGPDGPRTPVYAGLGTLSSCDSGRRLAVLNAPPTDAPDGAPVGSTAPTGANGEEWLVWTEPDGGLVLQSLLSSGAPVPRLLTAERTGTAALRDEAPAGGADAAAQRWQLTDRRPQPLATPVDGSATADCLRIRTQDGTGCLLDHGAGAPLPVGDCSSRAAWWTPQGMTAPAVG